MAYSEDLQIYKDAFLLCKLLMGYSKHVTKMIRFGQYEVAVSKTCQALDLIRRINSSFDDRERNLNEFIMLISDVNSRITLFADAKYIDVRKSTNLNMQTQKVLQEAYGWLRSERKRKGESYRATARQESRHHE